MHPLPTQNGYTENFTYDDWAAVVRGGCTCNVPPSLVMAHLGKPPPPPSSLQAERLRSWPPDPIETKDLCHSRRDLIFGLGPRRPSAFFWRNPKPSLTPLPRLLPNLAQTAPLLERSAIPRTLPAFSTLSTAPASPSSPTTPPASPALAGSPTSFPSLSTLSNGVCFRAWLCRSNVCRS